MADLPPRATGLRGHFEGYPERLRSRLPAILAQTSARALRLFWMRGSVARFQAKAFEPPPWRCGLPHRKTKGAPEWNYRGAPEIKTILALGAEALTVAPAAPPPKPQARA